MLIKTLTDAFGLPGHEYEVREIIKNEIKNHVDDMFTDRLGNLIAVKNKNSDSPHIAFSAHMDEVGLVVRFIEKDGLIRFASWGCDSGVLPAKVVYVGRNKVPGVIGAKPIHLQNPKERNKKIDIDNLFIDIGTSSREETEKLITLGDYAAFQSEFTEFGEYKVKAKALDDRVGCALIIEMLKMDVPYKISACFNAQEEVGLRGSAVSARKTGASLVVNIEGTISAETSDSKPELAVTSLGKGPAISLIDNTSVYLKKYSLAMTEVAEKNGIPYQYRRSGMGGTDASSFHDAGIPVIGVAVPCRYIHSPVSVMDIRDYENLKKLLEAFTNEYCQGKILAQN